MTASETGRDEARARELLQGYEFHASVVGDRLALKLTAAQAAEVLAGLLAEVRREERALENERCAEVCSEIADEHESAGRTSKMDTADECADRIRALPTTPDAGGNR